MSWFYQEAKYDFHGHQIAANLKAGLGTMLFRLYVDGEMVDSVRALMPSRKIALLRGKLIHNGESHVVEIYYTGNLNIYIDGHPYKSN